jgi:hypothetical protein
METCNTLIPVPFRNTTLFLVDIDGTPYTPMKPIVEGMGLDWASQFTKIKSNQRFASAIVITTMIAEDGKQREMVCFPLRKLPGWLMTIHPNKVKPDIRETVIAYQNECDDVLWRYWESLPHHVALHNIMQRVTPVTVEIDNDLNDVYVYAIRNKANGHIKLGISRDPQRRLSELQTANSEELELVTVRKTKNWLNDEQELHRLAQSHHIRGEWFTAQALQFIE